jgi:excisionase family DNA binding protein
VSVPVELADEGRAHEAGSAEDEDVHATEDITLLSSDIVTHRKPIGFSPPDEPLSPLFVRIPAGLAERLDQAASDLRRPKQELVAAALGDEDWALGRAELLPAERPAPEVLTVEQLAALLQLEVDAVRRLAARGELPGRKVGGHWRFSRQAVLEWLASSGAASD